MEKTNIYFIQSGNAVKIGRSKDVERRQRELQTSNKNKLKLLYMIEDMEIPMERHIQGICQRYHIKGEWFESKVIDFLQNLPWYKENMKIQK